MLTDESPTMDAWRKMADGISDGSVKQMDVLPWIQENIETLTDELSAINTSELKRFSELIREGAPPVLLALIVSRFKRLVETLRANGISYIAAREIRTNAN